ncbi:Zn-finger in Ran binding protein and others domain-containing protein [Toxoplasma gondii GAB2-2007-GAL-DOM2]|uniref:Zinc-finger-Ran binding domain-containing protein n=8 Tax=Toxoplasma gondii TaxID=5811 RepID=B9PRV7_TOXGV|nr:Zn-finger in Ran binding protein and others domain-containing protein [Toxoplasma gondii GT1]ESS34648.1 Zn-finger in Ran binding protein and others domain-containing protein [Toxoplasma gondii VEG]KAF4638950.1 Zn-finger in Ran binding protein and others domain-containing protein [Toxoplasma gondii]KFG34504.1 Zn-finger in Ran binding protein and others domain-containing protein [Toxoplasma gondii GAB2-2007-GAL-DOM2]KFG46029.1 Zn-finger in Ran binding protein and others domain-containing prote
MSSPAPYFSSDASRQNIFLAAPPAGPSATLGTGTSKATAGQSSGLAGRPEDADAAAILQLHLQLSQELQRSPVTDGDIFRALKKLARNSGSETPGGSGLSPAFLDTAQQGATQTEGNFPPPPPGEDVYTQHLRSGSNHSMRGSEGKRGPSLSNQNASLGSPGVFAGGSGLGGRNASAAPHSLSSLSFQGTPPVSAPSTPRGSSWRCRFCSSLNAGTGLGRCMCCGRQNQKRGGAKGSAAQGVGQTGSGSVQNLQIQQLRRDVLLAAVTAAAAAAEKRSDKKEAKRAAAAVSAVATAMAESRQQLLAENHGAAPYFSGRVGGSAPSGLSSDSASGTLYEDRAAAAAVAAASLLPGLLGSLEASSGSAGTPGGSGQSPATSLTSLEDGGGSTLFSSLTSFESDGGCVTRAGLIPELGGLKGTRHLPAFDEQSTPGRHFLGDSSSTGMRQSVGSLEGGSTPGTFSLLESNAYGVDFSVFQELATAPQSTLFTDDVTPADSLSLASDCRSPSGATPSSIVSGRSSFCNSGLAAGVSSVGGGRDSSGNSSTNASTPTTGANVIGSGRGTGRTANGAGSVSGAGSSVTPGVAGTSVGLSLGACGVPKDGRNSVNRLQEGAGRPRNSSAVVDAKRTEAAGFSGPAISFGSGPENSGAGSLNAATPSTQSSLPQHVQTSRNSANLLMKGDTSTSSCASFLQSAASSPSAMEGDESPVSALLEGLGLSTANAPGIDALLPSVLSPIQVLLLKAKEVADRLVGDFQVLGYNDPTAKAAEALRTSLAILGFAPPPHSLGGPEEDSAESAGARSGQAGKEKQREAGQGRENDDDRKPKNANWIQGIGGPHFSAPTMLAHPDEFKNPSSFLKIYGDPMCAVADASAPQTGGRQPGPGGRSLPGACGRVDGASASTSGSLPIRGHNGNWVCESCSNVNFPRRFRCNKCGAVRGPQGDAIVAEYAKLVYHQHVKAYRNLASRPGVDLPLKRLQSGGGNASTGAAHALQKGASRFAVGTGNNLQGHDAAFSPNGGCVGGSARVLAAVTEAASLNLSSVQTRQVALPAADSRKPAIPQPPSTNPNLNGGVPHGDTSRQGMNFPAIFLPVVSGANGVPAPPPPTVQPPVPPGARTSGKASEATVGRVLPGAKGVSPVQKSVVDEKKGAKKASNSEWPASDKAGSGKGEPQGNADKREAFEAEAAQEELENDSENPASGEDACSSLEVANSGSDQVAVSGKPSVTSTTSGPVSAVSSPRTDGGNSPVNLGDSNEATP